MAGEDDFFRGEVLDLLFEEENDEVLDKIFDPLFMEATVEVSLWNVMYVSATKLGS